jgi:hypothetical protein
MQPSPAGVEAYMAGKADLVSSIVDPVEPQYLQSVPVKDGWKIPESYADASVLLADGVTLSDG